MTTQGLTYEQHTIGARYETSRRTVHDADLSTFVNLFGFTEPLFMDMEFVARESVFKGRPAPGAFTFCLGSEIRIVAPVLAGDTLGVAVTVTDKRETKKPDRGIVTYKHEVTNQRGELVLDATVRRMIRRGTKA